MYQQTDSVSSSGFFRQLTTIFLIAAVILSVRTARAADSPLYVVTPGKPDIITMHPIYRIVQSSTEIDSFPSAGSTGGGAGGSGFSFRGGMETWLNDRANLLALPFVVTYGKIVSLEADLPFYSFTHSSPDGETTERGLGDIPVTLKLHGEISGMADLYYLISASMPTGSREKGIGSGSWQYSYTQKLVTKIAGYRATFMAGVTIPTPGTEIRVAGSIVTRQPLVTWMAAAERPLSSRKDLLLSLRCTGQHAFSSRSPEYSHDNRLTTLDIIPGIRYDLDPVTALTGGIGIPLLTVYELPGAKNSRNPFLTLGITRSF